MTINEAEKYVGQYVKTIQGEVGKLVKIHYEDKKFPYEIQFPDLPDGSPDIDQFVTFVPMAE